MKQMLKLTNFYLPESFKKALEDESQRTGASQAWILREALRIYLKLPAQEKARCKGLEG